MEKNRIYDTLGELFPNAQCELNYNNMFELLIAVALSAQTTDILVNKVTKVLFGKYPDAFSLAEANYNDVLGIIKEIGLANNKTKNIIALSQRLVAERNGEVPNDYDYLVSLPGVGRKTANVVLSEGFNVPRIAVDTHVLRVSNRLGIISSDDVLKVEEKLMEIFPKECWHKLHHRMIFFGRYMCKAKNPLCQECPFIDICTKNDK